MSSLRAVTFDMDGLMFNTEDVYQEVGAELMRRRGLQYTRELSDAVMGRPPQACFETMIRWHGLDDRWQAMATESESIFVGMLDGHLAPMPGPARSARRVGGRRHPQSDRHQQQPPRIDRRPLSGSKWSRDSFSRSRPRTLPTASRIPRFISRPPSDWASHRKKCSCSEDSQTGCRAARPRRGRPWLPCPANTAADRISASPALSSTASPIRGSINCWD